MYCGKCGSFNQDGATFCQNCGSPLTAQTPPQQNPYPYPPQQPKKKKTGLIIGLCVAIAAVITGLVFLGIWLFGDDGPLGGGKSSDSDRDEESDSKGGVQTAEDVAKAYITAFASADADAFMELMPQKVIDAYLESTDLSERELQKEFRDTLEFIVEPLNDEYGDDWSMSAEDIEADLLGKSDLKTVQERYDALDLEVTDAAIVSFTRVITVRDEDGDEDTVDTFSSQLGVVEIGRRWYFHDDDLWEEIDLPGGEDEPSRSGFLNPADAVAALCEVVFVDRDAEAVLALIPDALLEYVLEEFDLTVKEVRKELQRQIDEMMEEAEDEYGEDFHVSVDVDLDSDWTPTKDYMESYQEIYEGAGSVSDIASVNCLIYVRSRDRQIFDDNMFAVEIDGRWYPECADLLGGVVYELTDD